MPGQDEVFYEFGPMRIDSARHTLGRGGEEVPIPPRALDALLLLVHKRGELVSKEELLSSIWPDTHVEEANLPVMISTIRRAIGDDGRHQKYIQTVSKSGYRFVGEVKAICAEAPVVEAKVLAADPSAEAPVVLKKPAEPVWRAWLEPVLKQRYGRFMLASGGAAAACAALVLAYWLASGSTVAGYVKAASRAVSGTAAEPGIPAESAPGAAAEIWYQKGRYAWNLHTAEGTQRSIEYFQNAVNADPGYAPGYAGLAMGYSSLPSFSQQPGEAERVKARTSAAKALHLDDRQADVHNAAGIVYMVVDRNFGQAEKEFRRAIVLDPKSVLAEEELSICLVSVGQTDEAVEHARRAKALDPLSTRATLGAVLFYDRRFMEAETEFDEILKMNPYSYRAYINLGRTYLSLGKYDEARRAFEEASRLSNHDPVAEGHLAQAEALEGNTEGAKTILAALEKRAQSSYVAPISFAFALAGLGRMDDALVYLKKTRADRAGGLYLKVEPSWDALHNNPEFRQLVSEMTLNDTTLTASRE